MEELCRGGGGREAAPASAASLPPASPHPQDTTGEEVEGVRASSRESSIQPAQLPHLHTV